VRLKIEIPDKIDFSTQMQILIEHINYGNHLGNDKVLSLCHEARVRFFQSKNLNELNVFGLGIIMNEAQVQYINEGKYGATILLDLGIDIHSKLAFDIYYHLHCAGASIAKVKTGLLFYDYANKKVKRIPEEFIKLFAEVV